MYPGFVKAVENRLKQRIYTNSLSLVKLPQIRGVFKDSCGMWMAEKNIVPSTSENKLACAFLATN